MKRLKIRGITGMPLFIVRFHGRLDGKRNVVAFKDGKWEGHYLQKKEASLRRAEAVRQLMIDMGTSETQIKHVIGLGYDHEFHVEDLNADGSLNEKNAPENRAVLVIGTSTEAAQILEKYYIE